MQKNHFLLMETTHSPILNTFAQRRDLSLEAKGLGIWIGTMPDDFKFTENYFYEHIESGKIVTRTRLVRTAMRELISKNFLKKIKIENKNIGNKVIWYLDYNGIDPSELIRKIKNVYGLDAAISCAKTYYPHIKIKIETSASNVIEKDTIYFVKDSSEGVNHSEEEADNFWDFIARSQKISNIKSHIRKIKNLHAKNKFEDYDAWKEKYNYFMENSVGSENIGVLPASKLVLLNKYQIEIESMFNTPVIELGGGLKFSLKEFLLNAGNAAINDYFKLLKSKKSGEE